MRTRHFKLNEETDINITPMLDVVFIMLIFFIVTTSFNKETGLRIFSASKAPIHENKVKNVIIKLDANNNHSVNGVATKLEGIQPLLANLKAANPDIQAQVISSKEIKTGDLVNVLQQIKANNIEKYAISTF